MPVSPGGCLGPYELLSSLGAGGMGEVYRARDTRLGRDVAVKVIAAEGTPSLDRIHRFEQEARALAALDDPHILAIHDVGTENGTAYVVFELLEGETLRQRLERGALPTRKALELAVQICQGLAAAHARGIIHRDLKPENLFLTRDGRLKILDFGLAKLSESPAREQELQKARAGTATEQGMLLGTVGYMSPEQARGKPADARSDLFAVGAILYEMLSGRRAFEGATPADLLSAILAHEPPEIAAPNGAVPVALERVVRRCLEKDPEERFQSARDVAFALDAVSSLFAHGAMSRPGGSDGLAEGQRRRARWRIALAGASGLAATLLALGLLRPSLGIWPWHAGASPRGSTPPRLTRLTSEPGVQADPSLSPDGKMLVYSEDRDGNVDLWVRPVSGGNPVRITDHPLPDWQPDWSPDGLRIAFRSERDGGGIYVVSALGGAAQRIASFGWRPRWSPDGTRVLLDTWLSYGSGYVLEVGAGEPRPVATALASGEHVTPPFWHPDGKHLSMLGWSATKARHFLRIVSLADGSHRDGEFTSSAEKQFDAAGFRSLHAFQLTPLSDSILFEARSRDANSVWRYQVDPATLRVLSLEQVTAGAGRESDLRLSRDGRSAVFVHSEERHPIWSLPFDAGTGRVKGEGRPLFQLLEHSVCDLLRLRAQLLCVTLEGDHDYLWLGDVRARTRIRISADLVERGGLPALSPDGRHLAYQRGDVGDPRGGVYVATIDGREEHLIRQSTEVVSAPYGWSPHGRFVVGSSPRGGSHTESQVWMAPATPDAGPEHVIASSTSRDLWQTRLSPGGRWLSFNAVDFKSPTGSVIAVAPRSGGDWRELTTGPWDDRPVWSADGRTLYFLSYRAGFFNVWGIPFDPVSGQARGAAIAITRFDRPNRMIPDPLWCHPFFDFLQDQLILSLVERSSNIWMIEGIDR